MKHILFLLLALSGAATRGVAQPVITRQPVNQTNVAGTTATFTVEAAGTPPLSYQWRSYANQTSFTNIPGAVEATLTLTNVQPTPRRFGVVVTDGGGLSVTSSPLAVLTVLLPPSITSQPALVPVPQSVVVVGGRASFSMVATGTPPLRYQWRLNNEDLPGMTNRLLSLTNVTIEQGGNYMVEVTNTYGRVESQAVPLRVISDPFCRVTNGPVVNDLVFARGGAWGDYDNDGFPDLFVANQSFTQTNQLLYHNNGDGSFTKITAGLPVSALGSSSEAAWGDFDNDGHLDLMTTYRVEPGIISGFDQTMTNRLFRGMGDGGFIEVNGAAVPTIPGRFIRGASWVDYDNDGFLDYSRADHGFGIVLYRNLRNGSFARITGGGLVTELIPHPAGPMGLNWGDYNDDGYPDVVIPISHGLRNRLFGNDGSGGFVRTDNSVFDSLGPDPTCVGSDWGDYDNDGDLDLFFSHEGGDNTNSWPNVLLRNDGAQGFIIVNNLPANDPEDAGGASWGCKWADYDNDGWLDLYVANRGPTEHDYLYRNNRDGSFSKVMASALSLNQTGHASTSCAWADYDNDGFLDLYVGTASLFGEPPRTNLLYHNNGNANHWVKFRLIGTRSNRSAIGAKVRLNATIHGQSFWQLREVSGSAWLGQNDMRPNFGLGDATAAETVRIEWPSGTVQELHDVASNQILTITEPGGEPTLTATRTAGDVTLTLTGKQGSHYDIEQSTTLGDWLGGTLTVTPTNAAGVINFPAPGLPEGSAQFFRARLR